VQSSWYDGAVKLITEKLRAQFGDIYLEVTEQDAVRRIGCLRRMSDNAVLTYHIVTFDPRGVAALGVHHTTIVAGNPMGEVIKHSGVVHTRSVSKPASKNMPPILRALFRTLKKRCRIENIKYTIKGLPYANIDEFYNPEFTPLPKLSRTR